MPSYTYKPRINGLEYEPGATIEIDGDTAVFGVESNVLIEGAFFDGNWIQGKPINGIGTIENLPLGKYYRIEPMHGGGKHGCVTSFELVKKSTTVPSALIGSSPIITSEITTKPRPTFSPGGHTLVANLDKSGMVADGIEVIPGGKTTGPDGKYYISAGYGWQISADDCTISNCKMSVFSDYAVYIRPGVNRALIEQFEVVGGTNFEASIRNAGGQVTLRNVTIIQDHSGIDNKKARTLLRGPGDWVIERCVFAGGTFGPNPMARMNAGQDLGFGEFQFGRGSGDMETSEGGQVLRGSTLMLGVKAAIEARDAGRPRREIVRAAIIGSLLRGSNATDIETLTDDTLWNRERMLAQRSNVVVRDCRFNLSPDAVPVTIEIQAGTTIHFENCEAVTETILKQEMAYPDAFVYPDRHPTNKNWTLPGDIVRPAPKITFTDCTIGGKAWQIQ